MTDLTAEQLGEELAGARATIDHMAKAMDWICGHDRQGLDHLAEAMYEGRAREAAVKQARAWAARARAAEADVAHWLAFIERGMDTHMQFSVIKDGVTEQLPCADWCYACRVERAEAAIERARGLATRLGEFAENALKTDDRQLYEAIAEDLRTRLDGRPEEPAPQTAGQPLTEAELAAVQATDLPPGTRITRTVVDQLLQPREADASSELHIHMTGDTGADLRYSALDGRRCEQALIDAALFAARMGHARPRFVSMGASPEPAATEATDGVAPLAIHSCGQSPHTPDCMTTVLRASAEQSPRTTVDNSVTSNNEEPNP